MALHDDDLTLQTHQLAHAILTASTAHPQYSAHQSESSPHSVSYANKHLCWE